MVVVRAKKLGMNKKWDFTDDEFFSTISPLEETRHIGLEPNRNVPIVRPDWFDEELFKRGQQLAHDYVMSISLGQILGLIVLFSFRNSIQPLIYTRRSDSVEKAKSRYMSTAVIVKSWYESDLWDKESDGFKNLQKVREYHLSVSNKINSLSPIEIETECTLYGGILGQRGITSSLVEEIKSELQGLGSERIARFFEHTLYFSQAEMFLTVFGFMGFVVVFPEKFGIPTTEEEEGLAGFVHLWRTIGYLLGVKDEYNLCKGDYGEVKQRCKTMLKLIFRPNMENLNEEWEHMSRCVVEGINSEMKGFSFEELTLYLFWLVDLNSNDLMSKFSWSSRVRFYILTFLMTHLYGFRFFRYTINLYLRTMVEKYLKRNKRAY